MIFTQALDVVHWIQWKPIFLLTICLMVIHTLVFQRIEPDVGVKESPTTSSPPKTKPNPLPLTGIQGDNDPLVVERPEDHAFPPDGAPSAYIAVCMAIRDQGPDLKEFFVHHYHHLGIRHFYIMDDASNPPLSTFEYPGVPRSALTFVVQDPTTRYGEHFEQIAIYARCMGQWGSLHTWMAFIDGDEYFETTGNETLHEILEEFEDDMTVGALAVNWRMHTSCGLLKRPKSARKAFVECISDGPDGTGRPSDNRHVKVIVKTSHAGWPTGPHMWVLSQGNTVGEHGDIVQSEAWRDPVSRDRIALHHYAVKSREEYEEKMHRGNAMDDPKGESFWDLMENVYPHVDCYEMAKYDP